MLVHSRKSIKQKVMIYSRKMISGPWARSALHCLGAPAYTSLAARWRQLNINRNRLCLWEPLIFDLPPPTNSTSLDRSPNNLSQVITSATATPKQIWCKSAHGEGLLGKCVKYNHFLFIYTLFLRTHLQVRLVGGCLHLMAQTTRTRAKMCLLGFVCISVHIKGQMPPKPRFGGATKHF